MALESKLAQISRLDTKEQAVQFVSLSNELIASGSVSGLKALAQKVLGEEILSQVAKPVLINIASSMKSFPDELFYDLAVYLVTIIKQSQSSAALDEADFMLRDALFSYCVGCEEYTEAAQFLAGTNLESTSRLFSDLEKVDIYIKCAEAVLEADEAIDAEIYVNKASALINAAASQSKGAASDVFGPVQLRFRVTYARVLDANRKFVEAAVRYYGLSTTTGYNVLQGDLLELLGKAVTCAILGKAGQQRSRVLAMLMKDERLGELDGLPKYVSHRSLLTKIHLEQIIRKGEVDTFAAGLLPHQKAVAGDGYSLLERAVIEHNMVSVARVYCNISLAELGTLVALEPDRAEKIAAVMITEGRLRGCIDQTEGYLVFEDSGGGNSSWDQGISDVCNDISSFADTVAQQQILMA